MLQLKKVNMEDAKEEWACITNMPEDENGLTNLYHGISLDDFIKYTIPE